VSIAKVVIWLMITNAPFGNIDSIMSGIQRKYKKPGYKEAKLQARIKPTALCSAIDKENSIEFLLDFLHYLYNYYMVCALLSYAYYVTYHVTSYDMML